MTSRYKPVSRLSIIFILAVVISGSILTWFSINSISNLKELTEKRVLEEQRELDSRIKNAAQSKITTITESFKNEINPPYSMRDSLINSAGRYDFITMPFILKKEGQFLYPNFIWSTENTTQPRVSSRFNYAFRKGEEAEFAKNYLRTAKNQYLLCLSYSTTEYESVKALNALGRISVKLNEYENSIGHYEQIILNHPLESNTEGVSYVYYALQQLLKVTNASNFAEISPLIVLSLEKMKTGSIPLNFGTEEFITQVEKWVQENTTQSLEKAEYLNQLITNINSQLQFVNEYRNEMLEILKEVNLGNHLNIDNDFKMVNSVSGNNQNVLLVNANLKNPAGFLIDANKLLDTILKTVDKDDFTFGFTFKYSEGYNLTSSDENLIYTSQLSPYFPTHMLNIKLTDENLINDIVKRRSWIYGIATTLLMVAMILGVVLILRDVARERHLMQLRSDFISNVTHELKTPLTSIYMFAETLFLGRVKSASGKKEYLSIILKESLRLKRMVNNILEFSKMEKGKSEYRFIHSDLAPIIRSAIQDMSYWFQKGEFEIVTNLDENIEVEIDPEKMKQAIGNLLNNAYKYSTKTKKIIVRLIDQPDDIVIEIEDKGIGIPEDQLTRIFEKYHRIEQQENISGTGLGLTVVKEIIEAHQGKITVSSQLGKGSKFTIVLNRQNNGK
ncbi:MAG: GHKL domain-containing protein [Saprospiraceae bacterium]|nr:GHKL domain-containing protein [Saprospiraceae bacterium]